MAGRLFIARHGEREDYVNATWNDTASYPYDPPLSKEGFLQAERLGRRLAGKGITRIISSPFRRTLQTASSANIHLDTSIELDATVGEHLSEHAFHEKPALQINHEPSFKTRKEFPRLLLPSGCLPVELHQFPETEDKMSERADKAIHNIAQRLCLKQAENVLVVSHAIVARAMVLALIGEEEWGSKLGSLRMPGYCACFELVEVRDGSWTLVSYYPGGHTRWIHRVVTFLQDKCMECLTGPLRQRGQELYEYSVPLIEHGRRSDDDDLPSDTTHPAKVAPLPVSSSAVSLLSDRAAA